MAEDLAWAVNAPTDLPSRGATAFLHTLQLASEKAGHTHLPWEVLIMHTQRLLSSSGAENHLWLCVATHKRACLPWVHPMHDILQLPTLYAHHGWQSGFKISL